MRFPMGAVLIVSVLCTPLRTLAAENCVVRGRVVDAQSGEAIRKAQVRLVRYKGGQNEGPAAVGVDISEADGSFCIATAEPGDYLLAGRHAGYLNTRFGAKGPGQVGTVLTLSNGQRLENLTLALIPQAVITGRVVDADGDPVNNINIAALTETWSHGKARYLPQLHAQTNDLGEFRVASVGPGKYYLLAEKGRFGPEMESTQSGEVRPVPTFYPSSLTRKAAAMVELKAGQQVSGLEIRLISLPTVHVRGQVAGNLFEAQNQEFTVSLHSQDSFVGPGPYAFSHDRVFDIPAVSSGDYTIRLYANSPHKDSWNNIVFSPRTIEVGDSDIDGLVLTIQSPTSIKGNIRVEAASSVGSKASDLSGIKVWLINTNAAENNAQAQVNADGTFNLEGTGPGHYYLQVLGPVGTYLQSARLGQKDVTGKQLDLTGANIGDLQIVFRYGRAEVEGTVQMAPAASAPDAAPVPCSAAAVVLIPEVVNEDGSGMYFGNANQNGAFHFQNVKPGRYRAYALAEGHLGPLQDAEARKRLASRGVDVSVGVGDKKHLELTFVPEEELLAIYEQGG